MSETGYDVAIVGGGLAGLALAIQLAQQNLTVCVLEQKRYPFHRVCGEYISLESWPFLQRLGLDLAALKLPQIRRLLVSDPAGRSLTRPLQPGGFGISRYLLDQLLAQRAEHMGVVLRTQTPVRAITSTQTGMRLSLGHAAQGERLEARVACGAFGKYANLDRQLRPAELPQTTGAPTFVGIKYHLRLCLPPDLIALHNFAGGYCGISRIEAELACCCYLVSQAALDAVGGQRERLEREVLGQNPYLKSIWAHAEFCFERPQAIAQIHFAPRSLVQQQVLMLGDAAGLIPPLCGNGMSMALHSSHLLAQLLPRYLSGQLSRSALEASYTQRWQQAFGLRLWAGRLLQEGFGRPGPVTWLLRGLRPFPGLADRLIGLTHGEVF